MWDKQNMNISDTLWFF